MTGVLVVTFRVDVRHRTTDDDALRPEASGSTAGRTPQLLDLLMLKIDWDLHGRLEARGHMLGRWSSVRIESELASREPGSRIRKPRGWPRARCSSLEFAGQTARGCCGLAAGFGRGGAGPAKAMSFTSRLSTGLELNCYCAFSAGQGRERTFTQIAQHGARGAARCLVWTRRRPRRAPRREGASEE